MLYLNSIKNGNIRGKKISQIFSKYMHVNVKTRKKGEKTRATSSVFAPKIRHMVANIYVWIASLQNLFETCNEIVL